ncbi:hypothetical protein FOZ63_008288, partial [Perkinsus olseni]
QIENQEFVRKIDEANKELISLKKNYTRVTNQVNLTKKRIGDLLSEEALLKQEIDGRKRLLSKAEQDILKVVSEREKARKENSKLRVQSRNSSSAGSGTGSDGPRFMECLTLKVEEQNLERARKNLERKLEIAEGECKRLMRGIR